MIERTRETALTRLRLAGRYMIDGGSVCLNALENRLGIIHAARVRIPNLCEQLGTFLALNRKSDVSQGKEAMENRRAGIKQA